MNRPDIQRPRKFAVRLMRSYYASVTLYVEAANAEDAAQHASEQAEAATDGLDTDWTAMLVDVSPTGYAKNLCDGIIRARFREGFTEQKLLEPGKVYKFEIDLVA